MAVKRRENLYLVIMASLLYTFFSISAKEINSDKTGKKKVQTSVSSLRIRTQISGWKEADASYTPFTPDGLYDIIDGGADFYITSGLKKGIYQRLNASGEEQCEIFTEDFGSVENAKKIFNAKQKQISQPLKLDRIKGDNVIAEEFIGAIGIYFYKGKFYCELSFSGFNNKADALKKAFPIIEYLLEAAGS